MRSLLVLAPDSLDVALRVSPDVLVLDLAAAPDDQVESARRAALGMLRDLLGVAGRPRITVRIHPLASPFVDGDLDVVMTARPDMIWLPQAGGGDEIALLDARISVREALHGIADGATQIIAGAAETPASLFALGSYLGASRRLAALAWNGEAMAAALGHSVVGDVPPPQLDQPRFMLLAAARAAGLPAIDGGVPLPSSADMLRRDCARLVREGFTGRLTRDPGEVTILNALFAAPVSVSRAAAENGQLDLLTDTPEDDHSKRSATIQDEAIGQ